MDHCRRLAGPDLLDTKTVTSNHRTLPENLFPFFKIFNQPKPKSEPDIILYVISRAYSKESLKIHIQISLKIIAPNDHSYVKKCIKYQTIYRENTHESGIDEKNTSSGLRTFAMGESNLSPSKSGKL